MSSFYLPIDQGPHALFSEDQLTDLPLLDDTTLTEETTPAPHTPAPPPPTTTTTTTTPQSSKATEQPQQPHQQPPPESTSSTRKRQRTTSPHPYTPASRKRRSTSPTSTTTTTTTATSSPIPITPPSLTFTQQFKSEDPNEIIKTLNQLLKLSADQDVNFALGEGGNLVMDCLVDLFDDILGWKWGNRFLEFDANGNRVHVIQQDDENENITNNNGEHSTNSLVSLVPTKKTWVNHASPSNSAYDENIEDSKDWPTFCAVKFAPTSLNSKFTPNHTPPSNLISSIIGTDLEEGKEYANGGNSNNVHNDNNKNTDMAQTIAEQDMKTLEVMLMILRNLSYVAANIRFLTHNIGILRLLTGCLYYRQFRTGKFERGSRSEREENGDLGSGNSHSNICVYAIQTFLNLAPHMDASGRKVFADIMFLESTTAENMASNTTTYSRSSARSSRHQEAETLQIKTIVQEDDYGKVNKMGVVGMILAKKIDVKDESLSTIPDSVIQPFAAKYIHTTLQIFPALAGILNITTSRSAVVGTLELLKELMENEANHVVFEYVTDHVLYYLVRLLWIPRLGFDSFEYIDPILNSVSRVSSMKLLGSYDVTVDYELRDRSLELLVRLTSMNNSADIKKRLGRKMTATCSKAYGLDDIEVNDTLPNTRLYDGICPALNTRVGRDQTPQMAAKLLANIVTSPENHAGLMYAQRRILCAACSNPQVSNLLMNNVLNVL